MYDAVVLGAGVLGLSIATELTGRGVKVAVVGRDLPEDQDSTGFASPWAGANWASFAKDNEIEQKRDAVTFKRFAKLAEDHPDLITRTPYVYVWNDGSPPFEPWYKDLVFDFRRLSPSELAKGFNNGVGFTSYTLNPPAYIAHLAKNLRGRNVPIVRHRVSSLDEVYSLLGPVNLVINATGLGSRSLLGVADPKVFPARGQTVLVRAPHVRTCYANKDANLVKGRSTYIIPRPGPEGHVILGGCFLPNEYSTQADPVTAEGILKDTYALCPELGHGKGWEEIEVVSHNVGLRPAREGGLRLELEERVIGEMDAKLGLMPKKGLMGKGRKVGVVHAYGIGPAGYQASLGIAEEASDLALRYLKKIGAAGKL